MRNNLLIIAIFTAVALVAGCGGSGKLVTYKVTGTVTMDGEPLAGASVFFTPKSGGQGDAAVGKTDENGQYVLQTILGNPDAGTSRGEYMVHFNKKEIVEMPPPVLDSRGRPISYPEPPSAKSLIPIKYEKGETSGLTATVEKGKKNEFDFDLLSK